jgi:hypothetical protein
MSTLTVAMDHFRARLEKTDGELGTSGVATG